MNEEPYAGEAHAPREIAHLVEGVGVAKARLDTLSTLVLAVLAGAFIALGALFFLVVTTGAAAGFGVTRLLGGVAFSLGLILVVVAGAELFTGNNLLAIAWASRLIATRELLRSWLLSYFGNVVGGLGTVLLALGAGVDRLGGGAVGQSALRLAVGKIGLTPLEAFTRGVLCNVLVCLAVWLAMGARSVTDKIMAIVFPVSAFVALGLEHSVANWFFLPFAMALDSTGSVTLAAVARNLAAVTAGNIVGGTLLVALVYWVAYLRGGRNGAGDRPRA
jgi:formate/nitrite transporter